MDWKVIVSSPSFYKDPTFEAMDKRHAERLFYFFEDEARLARTWSGRYTLLVLEYKGTWLQTLEF